MAAADTVVYEAVMKEGWTQEKLESQFLKNDPLLEEIEVKGPSQLIGEYALTPVHTGRAGGVTFVPPTGSKELNAADSQKTAQAKWKYRRVWDSIELDTALLEQTGGKNKAVVDAVDMEVEGNLSDLRKQVTRTLFLDQTGLICKTKENTAKTVLELGFDGTADEYNLGIEATRQGWLVEGQQIDIGTTSEEAVVADGRTITAVDTTASKPTITISGEAVNTTTSHYVSLKNSRSATTSYEPNGMRHIASTSTTLGEIAPATEPGWKAAFVDTAGGAITRQRVIAGRRQVRQVAPNPDRVYTSLKQVEALENETYPQVRFQGTDGQDTGDGESIRIGSLKVQGHEDCPDGDFTYANSKHLFALRAKPAQWVSQNHGGSLLHFQPGSTFLYGAMEFFFELCTNRRNTIGQFRKLA